MLKGRKETYGVSTTTFQTFMRMINAGRCFDACTVKGKQRNAIASENNNHSFRRPQKNTREKKNEGKEGRLSISLAQAGLKRVRLLDIPGDRVKTAER